jgi:hypothetical protein
LGNKGENEILKEIAAKVRAAGGDIVPVDLRPRYVAYLSDLLRDSGLLTDDLKHLLGLYEHLESKDYFSHGRPSTSSKLMEDLQEFVNPTSDDSLASIVGKIFISHQLIEEQFFRLVKASHFLIDLRMGSYRVRHPDLEKQNLYHLCNELERCVGFPSRSELVQEARRINGIRNRIAHSLLSEKSSIDLRFRAEEYLVGFRKVQSILDNSFEELYFTIKDFRKWSDMFEDDLLLLLRFQLDKGSIPYQDEKTFAERNGLVI